MTNTTDNIKQWFEGTLENISKIAYDGTGRFELASGASKELIRLRGLWWEQLRETNDKSDAVRAEVIKSFNNLGSKFQPENTDIDIRYIDQYDSYDITIKLNFEWTDYLATIATSIHNSISVDENDEHLKGYNASVLVKHDQLRSARS